MTINDTCGGDIFAFDLDHEQVHLRGTRWRHLSPAGERTLCRCVFDAERDNITTGETRYLHGDTEVAMKELGE